VSPLNRALHTAKIILKKNKIKARKIIVLPELS
jgi:broad specificity phosphatase PhoE